MARSHKIVDMLKQELRTQGMTYRELAEQLDLSESTVKHMFSAKNFSLKRMDKACEILGLELTDLVGKLQAKSLKLDQLTLENEKRLISELPLLIVAYCITNLWTMDDILQQYTISKTECIRCLVQLDRMQMIELQPDNKVRLLVSNNFKWHKNGPIERFFRSSVQDNFFSSAFNSDESLHMVKIGDITDSSIQQLINRLENVGALYEELSTEDCKQPFNQRYGTSMVLAIRKWEFQAFKTYLR